MKHKKKAGTRIERLALEIFKKNGYSVLRSPASKGKFDLLVDGLGEIQVKYRSNLRNLYKNLNEKKFIKTKEDFYVMFLEDFLNKEFINKEFSEVKRSFSIKKLSDGCDIVLLKSPKKDFVIAIKKDKLNKILLIEGMKLSLLFAESQIV